MIRAAEDFLGCWQIAREITDARAGSVSHFSGTAEIAPDEDRWLYSETGTLVMAHGLKMQAERRYIWKPDATGIDIFFADSRFFHRLALGPTAQASHWCDPDTYEVTYALDAWPLWHSLWRVQGPRKNYAMRSRYTRAA